MKHQSNRYVTLGIPGSPGGKAKEGRGGGMVSPTVKCMMKVNGGIGTFIVKYTLNVNIGMGTSLVISSV